MRTVLALVFFAFGSVAVLAQQPKPPVRVYIWSGKAEAGDLAQKDLEDSVRDLVGKLDPKWLVASSQDTSEIQLEIVNLESPGAVTIGSPRAGTYRKIPIITLNAVLRFNGSSTGLACTIGDKTPTWLQSAHTPTRQDAAAVCAKKTRDWVKGNLKQLRPGETPTK
jgi:hypothetical protein